MVVTLAACDTVVVILVVHIAAVSPPEDDIAAVESAEIDTEFVPLADDDRRLVLMVPVAGGDGDLVVTSCMLMVVNFFVFLVVNFFVFLEVLAVALVVPVLVVVEVIVTVHWQPVFVVEIELPLLTLCHHSILIL